jgi:hypothetical protein
MASLRSVLMLRGDGDLSGVARKLHHATLRDRPWVVRAAGESGLTALRRANDGMLYLDARTLPRDVKPMAASLRSSTARTRLVVAASTAHAAAQIATLIPRLATIWIPSFAERTYDFDRLVDAYGHDAAAELGAPQHGIRPYDREWVRAGGARTLAELEDVTRRIVALRNWGIAEGGRRIGITHGAMSRWARRRKLVDDRSGRLAPLVAT